MMLYKDRMFCFDKECLGECGRKIDEQELQQAMEQGFYISMTRTCPAKKYKQEKEGTVH